MQYFPLILYAITIFENTHAAFAQCTNQISLC